MKKVIAITGLGGIGIACARRIGAGFKLVLGDFNTDQLEKIAEDLENAGYDVTTVSLDVSDKKSVDGFAKKASELGEIAAIVHTAGISPNMGAAGRIVDINLIGTARMIEAFEAYLAQGTVGVFISSNSGYLSRPLSKEEEVAVATLSADELRDDTKKWNIKSSDEAYVLSKRANHFQVVASASRWGKKGARIISISPGIISTPMSKKELETSKQMGFMIENTPADRIGTPEDIAATVEFLIGPAASFISGCDILVDGGITAFLKTIPR
ncbi:MAG: SDR family oxidoreductase [Prevotella sp.]|jgi:NAD(P)-dependent dehydrogenase (short-subunit alcohol dehydrogenase family)|nr:SDR family oxidoreductase [Prevotella sp.]